MYLKNRKKEFNKGEVRNWKDRKMNNIDKAIMFLLCVCIIGAMLVFNGCSSSSYSTIHHKEKNCKCEGDTATLSITEDGHKCDCDRVISIVGDNK